MEGGRPVVPTLSAAVVGNITRDTLYLVDRLPLVDDVATIRRWVECFGGRGAATSTILSGTYPVRLVTGVPLSEREPVTAFLQAAGDASTGIDWYDTSEAMSEVLVTIGEEDEDCTSLFRPGFEAVAPSDNQREVMSASDILYLTTHGLNFNLSALSAAGDDCVVIANITAYMFARPDYRDAVLERAEVLVGNEGEWVSLLSAVRSETPTELFSRLPRLQQVYRTMGARGAQAFDSFGRFDERAPAAGVNVRTPVGVGDAFAAGVVAARIRGSDGAVALGLGTELAQLSLASEETCVGPAAARTFFDSA